MPQAVPFELFLILILLVFAFGLAVGHRAKRGSSNSQEAKRLHPGYYKGLNYLLNEQTDKALNVFLEMLKVGEDTAETHIALGNLFRQRGEVDQAIRIHQNVIANPSLTSELKNQALYELAQDFMHAGLLDRAENLYKELITKSSHIELAYKQLLSIYQQEKDWQSAVTVANRLESVSGKRLSQEVANFYCELSQSFVERGDFKAAQDAIKRALGTDKKCVRASLIEGKLEQHQGNYKQAVRAYRRVEQQDPNFISETMDDLFVCYEQLGKPKEMTHYLEHVLEKYGGITSVLTYADYLRRTKGDKEAVSFIAQYIRRKPSVRGLDRLIEISLDFTTGGAHDNLLILKELTTRLQQKKPVYQCGQCGFQGKSLHWQCPSCKTWCSTKPIQGIEGE